MISSTMEPFSRVQQALHRVVFEDDHLEGVDSMRSLSRRLVGLAMMAATIPLTCAIPVRVPATDSLPAISHKVNP